MPAVKDCHVDNFSLLPPTEDRRHKQIFFWFLLNDCDEAGKRFIAIEVLPCFI